MRIDPQQHGWMTAPETIAVMAALGEARFVGGAVRGVVFAFAFFWLGMSSGLNLDFRISGSACWRSVLQRSFALSVC